MSDIAPQHHYNGSEEQEASTRQLIVEEVDSSHIQVKTKKRSLVAENLNFIGLTP